MLKRPVIKERCTHANGVVGISILPPAACELVTVDYGLYPHTFGLRLPHCEDLIYMQELYLVLKYFIQVETTQKRIGCGLTCDITPYNNSTSDIMVRISYQMS